MIFWLYALWFVHIAHSRCTGDEGPTEYQVLNTKLFYRYGRGSTWQPYFIRSIGYSPAPPTFGPAHEPYGDFYTTKFRHLFERDLGLIRKMGANSVRLWSWNYMGHSVANHAEFLDECWNNNTQPIRVLIPFDMGAKNELGQLIYRDLSEAETRRAALEDWKTLIEQYWRHPAVLGWLIGNELDVTFAGQLDELFSLANMMVEVAYNITDGKVQPITMPLSETNFIKVCKKYYAYSNLTIWSFQTYDADTDTPSDYLNATFNKERPNLVPKPLVVTEFGQSSVQTLVNKKGIRSMAINETYQKKEIVRFINTFERYGDPIIGYSVMEWVDEWWKTTVDYQNSNCPNQRPDLHTYCATYITTSKDRVITIHEEWLGLFSQTSPKKERSLTRYCIQPKESYFAVAKVWNGTSLIEEQCAIHRHSDPIVFLLAPMLLFLFLELCVYAYSSIRNKMQGKKGPRKVQIRQRPSSCRLDLAVEEGEMGLVEDEQPVSSAPRDVMAEFFDVKTRVAAAFEPYQPKHETTDLYWFAIHRLATAIWDHITATDPSKQLSSEELTNRCIRLVYIKQMEGFYIWKHQGKPQRGAGVLASGVGHSEPDTADAMLHELALYDIVRQYAGTINHCPEKTMEVYYYCQQYLQSLRGPALETARRSLSVLLLELFRIIYCYISQKVTLDDINANSLVFKEPSNQIMLGASEAVTASEEEKVRDSLTPSVYKKVVAEVQQHSFVSEVPLTGFTRAYFAWIAAKNGDKNFKDTSTKRTISKTFEPESEPLFPRLPTPTTTILYGSDPSVTWGPLKAKENVPSDPKSGYTIPIMKRTFTQRGGFPTTFYNVGWFVRIILWLAVAARYFQPSYPFPPVCLDEAQAWAAFLDAALGLILTLAHWRIFFQRLITWLHVVSAIYRITTFAAVYCAFLEHLHFTNLFPVHPSLPVEPDHVFKGYILLEVVKAVLLETRHFWRTHAYHLPGRIYKNSKKFFEGTALGGLFGFIGGAGYAIYYDMYGEYAVPVAAISTFIGAFVLGGIGSKLLGRHEQTGRELFYVFLNCIFWGIIWFATAFIFYREVIPVVIKVRPDTLCSCPNEELALTEEIVLRCKLGSWLLCTAGVVMVWLSVGIINFVWVFACFQLNLLFFGIWRGKRDRVGNVKNWTDVQQHFVRIKTHCFPSLSSCLKSKHNQMVLWNRFVEALYNEFLLTAEEHDQLLITFRPLEKNETKKWELDEVEKGIKYSNPLFLRAPRNEEARRRIIYFLWSLQAVAARDGRDYQRNKKDEDQYRYRKANRVLSMPSLTIITPCAAEPVMYTLSELVNPFHQGQANSTRHPRITTLEYIQCTYPDEWENFCNWLKKEVAKNPESGAGFLAKQSALQILHMFLDEDPRLHNNEFIVLQIRLWASCRGQTLVRLIRGVMQWRTGLELLATLENATLPESSQMNELQIQQMLATKFQFVICHQVYGTKANMVQTKDVDLLLNKDKELGLHKFDLVFPNDNQRFLSKIRRWVDKQEYYVERPGPLRPNDPFPTEPKAENQNHGLVFTNGQVLGVLDMNQTCPMEDAFKLPFVLGCYFGSSSSVINHSFKSKDLHANDVVAPYRIVGFAEWQYTRGLSMVGEVAGQAEFCFTSIHQRVCRWPLRARLHYGHPDFLDGHWVRTRGGLSHASHLVNTAEDVFTGYEVVGRGERVEYIEWLQVQKGKESALGPAFLFEKKLAQAAAQQMRSRDVYLLNRGANLFLKFGLFFGTYGFYLYNTLMALSIHLYMIAIVFFALSGVTTHDLGVNQSTLAVPWLFQVGFLFSFPLIVELSIEKGLIQGILHFLRTLPFALVYHLFQLQTRAAYFIEGLVRGKGGYIASQRGFGLDRLSFVDLYTTYASSHIHPAINLLGWMLLYSIYSQLTISEVTLRCLFIAMVVGCWLGVPILFNPYPTMEHLSQDFTEMAQWLRTPLPTSRDIAFLLFEEHKRHDVNRPGEGSPPEVTTKSLQQWLGNQRTKSWMAWYMSEVLLGPWGDEEMWFSPIGLLVQKSILGFLEYFPWLFWAYWASPSLSYSLWFASPLLLAVLFFAILDWGLPHFHEYFNIVKLYIPLLALGFALYFILSWKFKFKDIVFYLLFYIVLAAMLIDMTISAWNFYSKYRSWRRRTSLTRRGFVTRKRTPQNEDSIWFDRFDIPRFLLAIQKLYPLVALGIFTLINAVLCLFNNALTALLYCPAVASAWDRAARKTQVKRESQPSLPQATS